MAEKKIKLDEEPISEILVADTDFFFSKKAQICASNFSPATILDS